MLLTIIYPDFCQRYFSSLAKLQVLQMINEEKSLYSKKLAFVSWLLLYLTGILVGLTEIGISNIRQRACNPLISALLLIVQKRIVLHKHTNKWATLAYLNKIANSLTNKKLDKRRLAPSRKPTLATPWGTGYNKKIRLSVSVTLPLSRDVFSYAEYSTGLFN